MEAKTKQIQNSLMIISRSFPPFVVGSSILMSNLFDSYKGEAKALACWQYQTKIDSGFAAPCETFYLKMPSVFLQRVFDRFQHRLLFLNRLFIRNQIKEHQPDLAFLVYPNASFLVAAYQVCQSLKIPYVLQMHDLWEENYSADHPRGVLARKWEEQIFKNALQRYSMTEIQQNHYQKKYKLPIELLPHTIRPERIESGLAHWQKRQESSDAPSSFTIVYTGNISSAMNLDAIKQLVRAVDMLPEEIKVKMFVNFNEQQCRDLEVYHERIQYDWLPMSQVQEEMREADALFLPLSFKNASMDEVKTVYATKTLDYLVSGTPILVFSPSDSFHSISAKNKGWGHVVCEDSPEALVKGINQLRTEAGLRNSLVSAAFKEAEHRNAANYAGQVNHIVDTL